MYLSTTIHGIEDLAVEELKTLGARDFEVLDGKIIYGGDSDLFYRINYFSKLVNRVIILYALENFERLDDIKRIVYNSDFCISETFGVITERRGKHPFTSMDVSALIGDAILKKCPQAKVNLDDPDIRVLAFVKDDLFMWGIDTTGTSLHRRGYRIRKHPAALNPVIAAAMVRLSEWKSGILVDPFCGSGTIPIEAYHFYKRIPNIFRDFYFQRLPVFNPDVWRKIREEKNIRREEPSIIGIDKDAKFIQYAIENSRRARANIQFKRGLAQELHKLIDNVDFIVTNPPYGLRMGTKKSIFRVYEEFAEELEEHFSGTTMVIITPHSKFEYYFEVVDMRNIIYGELRAKIYKLKI